MLWEKQFKVLCATRAWNFEIPTLLQFPNDFTLQSLGRDLVLLVSLVVTVYITMAHPLSARAWHQHFWQYNCTNTELESFGKEILLAMTAATNVPSVSFISMVRDVLRTNMSNSTED